MSGWRKGRVFGTLYSIQCIKRIEAGMPWPLEFSTAVFVAVKRFCLSISKGGAIDIPNQWKPPSLYILRMSTRADKKLFQEICTLTADGHHKLEVVRAECTSSLRLSWHLQMDPKCFDWNILWFLRRRKGWRLATSSPGHNERAVID